MKTFNAYINGKFIENDKRLEIISPVNNLTVGSVSSLSEEHIELAFDSADKAFAS